MKRRSFLSTLGALAGGAVAAKAMPAVPVETQPTIPTVYSGYITTTGDMFGKCPSGIYQITATKDGGQQLVVYPNGEMRWLDDPTLLR